MELVLPAVCLAVLALLCMAIVLGAAVVERRRNKREDGE